MQDARARRKNVGRSFVRTCADGRATSRNRSRTRQIYRSPGGRPSAEVASQRDASRCLCEYLRDFVTDPVRSAGLDALAIELYELQCDLSLCAAGELMLTVERAAHMRERIAELEPLVGEHLHTMLREDDDRDDRQ